VTGSSDLNYGIARFASNCTLDTSYNFQRLDLGGVDRVAGMIIQSTGRPIGESDLVVLAGTTTRADRTSDIVLVRFAPDFVLPGFVLTRSALDEVIGPGARFVDTGFGSGGKAIIDTGGNEVATGLVRQRDGKLIVSGWVSHPAEETSDFLVARLTANGQLDPTFGDNGIAFANFGELNTAYALAVRGDNTVALAGCATVANRFRFAVAQFTASGDLDRGFHGDGKATLQIGSDGTDCAQATTFIGDALVVGGYSFAAGRSNFALAAFETTTAGGACNGDCDGDGMVAINELISAVNVALGDASLDTCPAADVDGDARVAINELIAAVRNALLGCGNPQLR